MFFFYIFAGFVIFGLACYGAGYSKDLAIFWIGTVVFGLIPLIMLMCTPTRQTFGNGTIVVLGCWIYVGCIWAGHYAATGTLPV